MSRPNWNAHVVKILKQHPREEQLSLEQVDRLAEGVFEALEHAVETIDTKAHDVDDEIRVLWDAIWIEAARIWRER